MPRQSQLPDSPPDSGSEPCSPPQLQSRWHEFGLSQAGRKISSSSSCSYVLICFFSQSHGVMLCGPVGCSPHSHAHLLGHPASSPAGSWRLTLTPVPRDILAPSPKAAAWRQKMLWLHGIIPYPPAVWVLIIHTPSLMHLRFLGKW